MTRPTPHVTVGQIVRILDRDYIYGVGELILRVTEVGDVQHLADGLWLNLVGIVLRPDGSVYQPKPRHALVRLAALLRRSPAGPQ